MMIPEQSLLYSIQYNVTYQYTNSGLPGWPVVWLQDQFVKFLKLHSFNMETDQKCDTESSWVAHTCSWGEVKYYHNTQTGQYKWPDGTLFSLASDEVDMTTMVCLFWNSVL